MLRRKITGLYDFYSYNFLRVLYVLFINEILFQAGCWDSWIEIMLVHLMLITNYSTELTNTKYLKSKIQV